MHPLLLVAVFSCRSLMMDARQDSVVLCRIACCWNPAPWVTRTHCVTVVPLHTSRVAMPLLQEEEEEVIYASVAPSASSSLRGVLVACGRNPCVSRPWRCTDKEACAARGSLQLLLLFSAPFPRLSDTICARTHIQCRRIYFHRSVKARTALLYRTNCSGKAAQSDTRVCR